MVYITSDANNSNVVAAINALNVPKPQVLIKVVFLEVTYNKGLDVGMEGARTGIDISGGRMLSVSNGFGLISQGINPTSGINTLAGANFATLTGNNFEVTLRAIEEIGKVQVLSRPTILARNAQPASINIGQDVPIISSVNVGALGQITTPVTYTPVGIQLYVTPFIYPNGDVEMILNPIISEVAPQSTIISSGTNGTFSTPYLNTRSANTVVVTPSGQTVVIGGLMQDSKTVTDSQIPFFGSIPVLGNLFKHKVKSNAKTELMIFVTPFVVKTPQDLARMSMDEVSRTELSPKSFSQKERDTYIDAESPAFPGAKPAPSRAP